MAWRTVHGFGLGWGMNASKFRPALLLLALAALAPAAGCFSPYYRDQGALVGGLGGAGIGAAIGEHNDAPLAGAAIGALAGTLAGAAVGDSIDHDIAAREAYIANQIGRPVAGAVTTADVVAMTQARLSENIIISHIQAKGVAKLPDVNDLIYLQNQGVSPAVIAALQQAPAPGAVVPATAVVAAPPPVVIHDHYADCYGPPPLFWHGHHHHHRPWHRGGFHWGFSVHR
jgi:hypothetical protein